MLIGKTLLSRYKISKKLGSGGFGDTYLAEDIALPGNPPCVVKHLQPKNLNPAVFSIAKNLFEREAEILYRLGENNQIPRLYAHFEEDGQFYLVQEFIEGHDLSEEITSGKRKTEEETVRLLQEILEVLVIVHQQNIIHRDIKPQNIMRRKRDGKIVLIDFGAVKEISTLAVNSQGQTTYTIAVGSPGYMPSEQANGKPKLASDIYAVGMIGIQALTGLSPHELQEDTDTGEIIWRNQVSVSDRLGNILNTMVRYHFRERHQNASEALQALMATVPLNPSFPIPITTVAILPPQNEQPPSSSPKLLPWVVAGGLLLTAIASFVLINQPSSPPASSITSSPTPIPEPTPTPIPEPTPTPIPEPIPEPKIFRSTAIWRSESGKTVVPYLDIICWGNNQVNSVKTVFGSPSFVGSMNFPNPKTGGCEPGNSLYGNFELTQGTNRCLGSVTVTWSTNNNAYIQWDITNSGSTCPISTTHWEINTYPVKQ